METRYLVGFDGSESSRRAFDLALELARATGGRVRVVTALQVAEGGPEACAMMMTDDSSQRARLLLDQLKSDAGDLAGRIDLDLVYGSPGDALMAQIQSHGIDHLFLGHSAHGTLARWLLGSVSDDIVSRARIPVTIVH